MSHLLLLSNDPSDQIPPALGLRLHSVRNAEAASPDPGPDNAAGSPVDAILVDARTNLVAARNLCRLLNTTGLDCPLIAVLTEGGAAALTPEWQVTDFLLTTAGPAEVEARLRLAIGRADSANDPDEIRRGDWSSTSHVQRPVARPHPRPHLQRV